MSQNLKELNLKNISNQELKYDDRRYVGQIVNGLKEGKGIMYYNNERKRDYLL